MNKKAQALHSFMKSLRGALLLRLVVEENSATILCK